jgi:hypothetical protein
MQSVEKRDMYITKSYLRRMSAQKFHGITPPATSSLSKAQKHPLDQQSRRSLVAKWFRIPQEIRTHVSLEIKNFIDITD